LVHTDPLKSLEQEFVSRLSQVIAWQLPLVTSYRLAVAGNPARFGGKVLLAESAIALPLSSSIPSDALEHEQVPVYYR